MRFLPIVSLMIFAGVAFLAYVNYSTTINFHISQSSEISIMLTYVVLSLVAVGVLAGMALIYGSLCESQNKLKEYKRKLEKTAINADCDNSKVAVLESKIAVLEKALQSALNKDS